MAKKEGTPKAYIDPQLCDRSPFCPVMRSCPARAIQMKGGSGLLGFGGVPVVDTEKCTGCGRCLKICPHGAVRMRQSK